MHPLIRREGRYRCVSSFRGGVADDYRERPIAGNTGQGGDVGPEEVVLAVEDDRFPPVDLLYDRYRIHVDLAGEAAAEAAAVRPFAHVTVRQAVWSDLVEGPVAVRYAWARNPLGNLGHWEHMERMIPVPTFRTDTWPIPFGPESEAMKSDEFRNQGRKLQHQLRKQAEEQIRKRKREEAELLYRSTRQ